MSCFRNIFPDEVLFARKIIDYAPTSQVQFTGCWNYV